jgi:hypothetical protein
VEVSRLSLDPAEVFKVMQCAYRNGVLDKFMAIQGEALEGVMAEAGVNMGDLLNRMDEATEEAVMKIDCLLDRAGPFMKYLDNDRLMKLSSRLLDIPLVNKAMVAGMKNNIAKTLADTPPPSLLDRLRALAGKAA